MHEEPGGVFVVPMRLGVFLAAFIGFSQLVTALILIGGVQEKLTHFRIGILVQQTHWPMKQATN